MKRGIKVFNSNIEYRTHFRNIKYPRLEFRTGKLKIILPKGYSKEEQILDTHKKWILDKHKIINKSLKASKNKKLNKRTEEKLRKIVLNLYEKYPDYNAKKIAFKRMKSKWGSCSSNDILTFNTLLKYLPKSLIEYVTYHEMMHLHEKKHNENFWKLIAKEYKNHQKKEKELFIYWFLINSKLKIQ